MKIFLFLAFLIFIFSLFGSFKVSEASTNLCTGLQTQINITHVNSSTTLLHYQALLEYSVASPGFEKLDIFYTKLYTTNSSFSASDLRFYSTIENKLFPCPSDLGNCSFFFPDGGGLLELVVDVEGDKAFIILIDDVTYFKGTVFWNDGMVLRPDDACIIGEEGVSNLPGSKMYLEYCCNRWETLPDAPPANNTCLEFTSNIDFQKQNQTMASLQMLYEHFVNQKMNIFGVNFTSTIPEMSYHHTVNYGPFVFCSGNISMPQSNCSIRLFDAQDIKDSEFAFFVELINKNSPTKTWNAIAGAFEFRNGILMRNGSDPFTPENSCMEYPFNPNTGDSKEFDNEVTSIGKFCCTKWQNPIVSGATYDVNLIVSNSTDFTIGANQLGILNATLQVSNNNYILNVNSFNSFIPSNYHVYIYANQFQTEDCLGNVAQTCSLPETMGNPYQWFFATTFAPDGFPLFSTTATQNDLSVPQLNSNSPCSMTINNYNYVYPKMYVQTTICLRSS